MKKLQLIGSIVAALFAFAAVAISSASAVEPVWLVSGEVPAAEVPSTTTGTLFLTDLGVFGGAVTIKCEGKFDGQVGPTKFDLLEEVLTPEGTLVSGKALVEPALSCIVTKEHGLLCKENELAKVWPLNLPWTTELVLMENGTVLDVVSAPVHGAAGTNAGYASECAGTQDTCEATEATDNITSSLENMAAEVPADVLGFFAWEADSELLCSLGGLAGMGATGEAGAAGEGGLIVSTEGLSLAISEK